MLDKLDDLITGTASVDLPDGHFINGGYTKAGKDMIESFDAGRGAVFARFTNGTSSDVDQAVANARTTFQNIWRKTAPVERGRILSKTAALILENLERLAIIETLDCGKPLSEARGDVRGAARCFEYYAGVCDKLQGQTFPLGHDYLGYSISEPIGVTAHIIPWNFPISTAARGIAPALAAGCCVVAKPAETTPFSALLLGEILHQAGLPSGVCNVITGTGLQTGAALVAHPDIGQVTFTGSVATGRNVMKSAADNITRVVLELGGKSPVVVLGDCDQDAALNGVLGAIFENAGQICSAGSRLIIAREIHDEFIDRLVKRAAEISVGHGLSDPQMGPLNSQQHLQKVAGFVDRAKTRGAEVLTGGNITQDPKTGQGWFYEPTIIANRPSDDELVQEEIFGPVLTVQIADDVDHALTLANDCQFGLVAGVYTSNATTAHRLARDIDAGQIYINEYFAGGIEVPFGGNKKSGFGREKGLEALQSYCKTKSVVAKI
ncbi:aldehyde dehydrogenase [Amylibacter kogurei]|uniref:Aldehyde dehydrogenase n=1 Tax=Paramylibacter kogurei TaxID=1889778 RepID=A0A2G5K6L3_9RHOB|nr:aldehyde dehydrogenase family protein [Amylibacter kogurei]PIB24739.1 aldehyde dehydrogenase [Amylibacter kogurei]